MNLGLKDKVIVVTGGSEGIGKAIALQYLQEGCKVAVSARRQAVLDTFYQECTNKGYGDNVFIYSANVTDSAAMSAFCDDVIKRFGKLDIWVNNAGKSLRKALMEVSDEEWNECLTLNLSSVFSCCKLAAKHMKKSGGGVIVNGSAFSGYFPTAGIGAYCVAKSGLNCLTRLLAAELAHDNIRVVAYVPGLIETPLSTPRIAKDSRTYLEEQAVVNRLGTPEDIAPAVVFLSSDLASYITGTDIEISGGKFCVQNPMYAWKK